MAFDLGDAMFNRWFLGGLYKGQYPEVLTTALERFLPTDWHRDMEIVSRPLDWAGINYYTRGIYAYDATRPTFPVKQIKGDLPKNDLGWEIYPQGLTDLLVRVSRDYTKLPLYVTENGMSENDDSRRVTFYDDHLKAILDAQKQGADVRGYFAWSLLDNYEWAEGYVSRFGIVHVDYETQVRTPKQSYRSFQGMLHNTR
jgi:beta-glucosidase